MMKCLEQISIDWFFTNSWSTWRACPECSSGSLSTAGWSCYCFVGRILSSAAAPLSSLCTLSVYLGHLSSAGKPSPFRRRRRHLCFSRCCSRIAVWSSPLLLDGCARIRRSHYLMAAGWASRSHSRRVSGLGPGSAGSWILGSFSDRRSSK